jgi:hypothetical protein
MAEEARVALLLDSTRQSISTQPPGPTGLVLLLHNIERAFNPLGGLAKCAQKYGDIVRLNHNLYLVNRPDWIERVLVNADGTFWDTSSRGIEAIADRFWGQGLAG